MELINNKSFNEICEQLNEQFSQNGFTTTPGGTAKLFADIIAKNLAEFYDTLELNHVQAFVTTATGEFLNAIGKLLACERPIGEVDDNYRKRITSQCLSLSKANETSIRLAALGIKYVDDIVMKKYSNGPGSFTVMPIISSSAKVEDDTLNKVQKAILDVCSYGEKVIIKLPTLKYVKLSISLTYSNNLTDTEKQSLAVAVRTNIIDYINSISIGDALIINELTKVIMQTTLNNTKDNNEIVNYACNLLKVNDEVCLFINQGLRWDEKFQVSTDTDAITVA